MQNRNLNIENRIIDQWRQYYITHRQLKGELLHFKRNNPKASDEQKNEQAEKFARKLNFQIERVHYFANTQCGTISSLLNVNLSRVKDEISRMSDSSLQKLFDGNRERKSLDMIRSFHSDFVSITEQVKDLLLYLDWNIKSIHRLRKHVGTYIGREVNQFRQLNEVDLLSMVYAQNIKWDTSIIQRAIYKTIDYLSFEETNALLEAKIETSNEIAWSSCSVHLKVLEEIQLLNTILGFINTIARVLDRLQVAEEGLLLKISQKEGSQRERGILREKGNSAVNEMILHKNYLMQGASTFKRLVYDEAGVFMDFSTETIEENARRSALPVSNISLNLLSTLLYIISMYAPLPSAGRYAQFLGSSEAVFGIIIGGTPFAGIFAAVLWSYLANTGFKFPLILSSIFCLLGNIVYASAATYESISVAIIGRLIVGIGGARAVNRRYIADNIPKSEQTMQSFYFVVASAFGMPMGPILSLIMNYIPSFRFMKLYFNDYTSGAWALVIIWTVYIIFLIKFFEEPKREKEEKTKYETNNPDEEKPLLEKKEKEVTFRDQMGAVATNPEIQFLLILYFVIKLVNEVALNGAAFYLPHIFGWSAKSTAIYLGILGVSILGVAPILRAVVKQGKDGDRTVLNRSMVIGAIMCTFSLPFFEEAQESIRLLILVASGTFIFIFMNAAESCAMSVISKVRPEELILGTWNTSLLTTQFGMIGRAAAGFLLYLAAPKNSEMSELFSKEEAKTFFIKTFLPTIATCLLMIFGIILFWDNLVPDDSDDNAYGYDADIEFKEFDESDVDA